MLFEPCVVCVFVGTKVDGKWKMMNYSTYYENVRSAAKGFIKVTVCLCYMLATETLEFQ